MKKKFTPRWTYEEEELLKEIYPNNTKKIILEKLKRPWNNIYLKAKKIGLKRNPEIVKKEMIEGGKKSEPPVNVWTAEEKALLKRIYCHSSKKIILSNFNRSWIEIRRMAVKLNLKRDIELIKKDNIIGTSEAIKKKYGVDYSTQLESMKHKSRQTNLKKLGVEFPSQSVIVKQKIKETNIKKFGYDNPFRSPEIKIKIKKTNKEKYGYEYATQSKNIQKKIKTTTIENNSFSLSDEEVKFYFYLKQLDSDTELQVFNPVVRNTIDFFSPKFNVWIQYDGDFWHGKNKTDLNTPRGKKIQETKKRDKIQIDSIPNLIRFSSSEINNQKNHEELIKFIEEKIKDKCKISTHCHQYDKKMSCLEKDLSLLPFDPSAIEASYFSLMPEKFSSEIKNFIIKYEWLGTVGTNPKWCFTARYKGILGGVILINEPNSYSKLLGERTPDYEALIQRGATASWTPKNLGSRLLMYSCRWMTDNTKKRLFIGYCDPKAREIGTIYQSCNFEYLGNNFGSSFIYKHDLIKKGIPFSEQTLKRTSYFKLWCRNNNLKIEESWIKPNGFKNLKNIPLEIKKEWSLWNKKIIEQSIKIPISKKHKYALLLAVNKKELKNLKKLKNYKSIAYPKRSNSKKLNDFDYVPKFKAPNKNNISNRKSRLTDEKKNFIIENYRNMTKKQIAEELKESERWVSSQIKKFVREGIMEPKNPIGSTKSRVTPYKIDFIKNNMNNLSRLEIAKTLNETPRWVKRQILKINHNYHH